MRLFSSSALMLVLFGCTNSVQAQSFPDKIVDDHWAAKALDRLRSEGLLVGYPDGFYRGGRPATRYEMAVALHAAYLRALGEVDRLTKATQSLTVPIQGGAPVDLSEVSAAVKRLRAEVDNLKPWGKDIDTLKTLAAFLEKELTSLGIKVGDLKLGLSDLEKRIGKLEANKPTYRISGEVNSLIIGSNADGFVTLNRDGRIGGFRGSSPVVQQGKLTNPAGITENFSVFNELALKLESTATTGARWNGSINFTNLNGRGFSDRVSLAPGFPYSDRESNVVVENLGVTFDLAPNATAELGRLGVQFQPMVYRRPDTTSYLESAHWDDGNYLLDGGRVNFQIQGLGVQIIGGNGATQRDFSQVILGVPKTGVLEIDRTLGINLYTTFRDKGSFVVTYLNFQDDQVRTIAGNKQINQASILAYDLNLRNGRYAVELGYANQTWRLRDTKVIDDSNSYLYSLLAWENSRVRVYGAYRDIGSNYAAPGDWGRLGIDRNPNNIKGFLAGARLGLSSRLAVHFDGQFFEARDKTSAGTLNGTDTRASSYAVRADYQLQEKLKLILGYEKSVFERTGADPTYAWTSFGLGYDLGAGGRFLVSYELSDITNERSLNLGGNRYRGGQLVTQVSIRF
ncbi:MAG: hypothetical protein ACOYON_03645 [Fimbriimonas sp.]